MNLWLIVDDHPLMRTASAAVVQQVDPQASCVFAHSVASGLEAAQSQPLHAAVVDLELPDGDGALLVSQLRQSHPALPILVLSATEQPDQVRRLIGAGASGYCPKSADHAMLTAALRLVVAGQTYVPPLMLEVMEHGHGHRAAAPGPGGVGTLTARQRDVLRLLCQGRSNKEIAQALAVAEHTVKIHVGSIFRAMAVASRSQAIARARQLGLRID